MARTTGIRPQAKEYHDLTEEFRFPRGGRECAHWTPFGADRDHAGISSSPGTVSVSIKTPVVHVSYKQGVLPQIFKLGGEVGGWWSILTLAFCLIFSKKHPDSPVAQIYEARTFVGDGVLPSSGPQKGGGDPVPMPFPPGIWKGTARE